ncbi:MAG: protoporphyrinogen oxidase [Pirellulaceae bacterium]|nr:MAG: protoporphyrinogen oxidase [Pirellulaceae bacterium]
MSRGSRVAILGGGISGLAAAFYVRRLWPEIELHLFEQSSSFGGVIRTEHVDGFLVEYGPDMFSTEEPWAVELCQQLGIDDQLVGTLEQHRRALVVWQGRLYPVPEGFVLLQPRKMWPILASSLLSLKGRMRLLAECLVPPRTDTGDESLASFAIRRFGQEAFERLIQPLVSGIYTADPYQLSMEATMQRFRQMEQQYGGLIRAAWRLRPRSKQPGGHRSASGARYGLFVAPKEGMQTLVDALVQQLPGGSLRTGCRVHQLSPSEGKWHLHWTNRDGQCCDQAFDAVVVALPNDLAAQLLKPFDVPAANLLAAIPRSSAAIAVLGIRTADLARPLDGFGYVCPLVENRRVLAGSFASMKFPGRAPPDHALVRLFLGGACQPELLEADDQQLLAWAREELETLFGYRGTPVLERLVRWYRAMPQYHVGHLDRIATLERLLEAHPGLALAGNAYRGVGIPQCIRSAQQAAARVVQYLQGRRGSAAS